MRIRLIGLALVTLGSCPQFALAQGSPSPLETAESYLEALYDFDFEALREYLATDAVFHDPTGETLAGTEISYEGRDEIIIGFEESASILRSAHFEVRSGFDSGEYVVLNLIYRFEVNGEAFGGPKAWIPVAMPAVTILRIVNGKIQKHLDHGDYDEFMRQVEEFANRRKRDST